MARAEEAINKLLEHEGSRYVPDDHGRGPSRYGVTLKTAQERFPNWTAQDIRDLNKSAATEFYRQEFWKRYHLERIQDQQLANKMLDLTVNLGGTTAVRLLQRAAGVEPVDGILGSRTAAAANHMPQTTALLQAVAEEHYRKIVEARPEWANCLEGWLARLKA